MDGYHHILITGAAGAIGGALTDQFARRYPQANFTLVDVNESALKARAALLGHRARAACWDLFQPDSLADCWARLDADAGPVDLLVNCAGIMDIKSFAGTGWELGWKLLSVNMISPLRLADLALQRMPAGGTIINVASMAGRVPISGCSYYGGAKAGMAQASEIMHNELESRNINVITVYPGPIYSGLESHARSQVKTGTVSKFIPTGQPDGIAERIAVAVAERQPRVIYPMVYNVAHYFNGVSRWVVKHLSPDPLA